MYFSRQKDDSLGGVSNWHLVKTIYRHEGLRRVVFRVLKKLAKPVIQIDRYVFTLRDLILEDAGQQAQVPVTARLLTLEDAECFAVTFNQPPDRVRQRFGEGYQCFVGIVDDQMVHFQWFLGCSTSRNVTFGNSGFAFVLRPGDTYAGGTYTLPSWRGKGIAAKVSLAKFNYLKSCGHTRKVGFHQGVGIQHVRSFARIRKPIAQRNVYIVRVFKLSKAWVFGAKTDEFFAFVRVQ